MSVSTVSSTPRPQPLAWLIPAVTTGSMVPMFYFAFLVMQDGFVNPISDVLNRLGLLALIFIVASLACTPLKKIFGLNWPLRIRRTLGLFAAWYAFLHFAIYMVFDRSMDMRGVFNDITRRKFIFVGFAAFVLLIPLANTSSPEAIRRMGAKRWQRLHRLIYPAAILAAIHYYWRVKIDTTEPLIYAGIIAGLLGVRLLTAFTAKTQRLDEKI
jgi:sulfoxide reductase heme-binding subunit YedZ